MNDRRDETVLVTYRHFADWCFKFWAAGVVMGSVIGGAAAILGMILAMR